MRRRPIEYPQPQYVAPILIDSNSYPWIPLAGAPGVSEKALGSFTSCQFGAAKYKLDPGAKFVATGRGIYLVLSGAGSVEEYPSKKFTTLYLEDGEVGTFTASEATEIVLLGLPSMALMGDWSEKSVVEPTH